MSSASLILPAVRNRSSSAGWQSRIPGTVTATWLLALATVLLALGAAWFANWRLDIVESDSMSPTVPRNSLAVVVPVTAKLIQSGDVIAFKDPGEPRRLLLHRVVGVVDQGSGRFFKTKGDFNDSPDALMVSAGDIQGKMRWHIPKLGAVARALRPPFGWIVLVALPALGLLIGELRRFSSTPGFKSTGRASTVGYSFQVPARTVYFPDDAIATTPDASESSTSYRAQENPAPPGAQLSYAGDQHQSLMALERSVPLSPA